MKRNLCVAVSLLFRFHSKSVRRFPLRPLTFVSCAALFLFLVGCGGSSVPPLAPVTGKVTNGGAPVANAIVTFTPDGEGRASTGEKDAEGKYELKYNVDNAGALVGQHTVRVTLISADDEEDYEDDGDGAAASGLPPEAENGSLVRDVIEGPNEINIEL